jgi:hypothetical protein
MEMSPDKIEAIKESQPLKLLRDNQSCLWFASFYQRYIKNFLKVCRPLTESPNGDKNNCRWTSELENAFNTLKERFISVPILTHFDPRKPCIVESDSSDFAIGAILSTNDDEGILHPVACHSRTFQPAKINYETHDKELLAVVDSFKVWRHYLEAALFMPMVYSDHQNLDWFVVTKELHRRHARWAQELASIDFTIVYHPGSQNGKPYGLSSAQNPALKKGE